jgi:hypothetical protein
MIKFRGGQGVCCLLKRKIKEDEEIKEVIN